MGMRILFRDSEGTLNCILATHISYDEKDSTFWFYADNHIWQTQFSKTYAEVKTREAYKDGKLDLSNDVCTLYKGEGE